MWHPEAPDATRRTCGNGVEAAGVDDDGPGLRRARVELQVRPLDELGLAGDVHVVRAALYAGSHDRQPEVAVRPGAVEQHTRAPRRAEQALLVGHVSDHDADSCDRAAGLLHSPEQVAQLRLGPPAHRPAQRRVGRLRRELRQVSCNALPRESSGAEDQEVKRAVVHRGERSRPRPGVSTLESRFLERIPTSQRGSGRGACGGLSPGHAGQ